MTERDKMLAGQLYDPNVADLMDRRRKAHILCDRYNALSEDREDERRAILDQLVPYAEGLFLQGPIYFDYGENIRFGKNVYANFHLTILDCAPVIIGDDVFIGPNVSIVPPIHPLLPEERNIRAEEGRITSLEYAKPITIGKNCWIASCVTINGGVTIGEGCVIGAGSVVTRDIPPYSLAAGVPCRVLRKITERDRMIR